MSDPLLDEEEARIIFVYLKKLDDVGVVQLPQRVYLILEHQLLLLRHPRLVDDFDCPVILRILLTTYSDLSVTP
jgi:hypothetical protein